jgi:uncharacterized membrane protein YhiD involved in acid resistance
VLDSIIETQITLPTFLICTGVSLLLGLCSAALCMYKSRHTQSFVITLAMLPAVIQVVIMLVNGNIGAGVAVAGAFSLIRFRSVPGTAKEIGMIFLGMAIGLATGMGYVVLAVLFFVIMAVFALVLARVRFGGGAKNERQLKITIPENLDYDSLFDDLFEQYALSAELERVKTTNMGTLYELSYRVVFREEQVPKAFLDELRCRNGNLNIVCGRVATQDTL